MTLTELATRLGLALALGFVIGLQRGWKERDEGEGHRAAGLRTFSLIGLLGGIFGILSLEGDRILIAAGFAESTVVPRPARPVDFPTGHVDLTNYDIPAFIRYGDGDYPPRRGN